VQQFSDAGCEAHFDVTKMWNTDLQKATIFTGERDPETGLYFIDLDIAELNPVTASSQRADFEV
jgi:hypothetical protein